MAYLPFYITPEEFSAYQEEQEQKILNGMNLTVWHKHDIEEPFRYLYLSIAIAAVSPLFFLTYFLHDSSQMLLTYILSGLTIIMSGVSYLTFGLDNRYDYTISEQGMVLRKRRDLPTWVNSAAQVMGWFGAVVCVFMVIAVGPMALVGAGGFILVSFRMLKRQPEEETEVRVGLRKDSLFAQYNKQRKLIVIYHKFDDCYFFDIEHKEVSRNQTRGRSYIFCKTESEVDYLLKLLVNKWNIECSEENNIKQLFNTDLMYEKLQDIPVRGTKYLLSEVDSLRNKNATLPELKYLRGDLWLSEAEIDQRKAELNTTKE
ncbi:hypothetical protein K0W38_000700 [Vibrio vulnificus]|uniref:hypothetical protein n=1 Tax=Vibrio vulnificus TaxID=672 RepID=UPI001DDBD512|nr:hypothetical protein [Vibrio vulnificus]